LLPFLTLVLLSDLLFLDLGLMLALEEASFLDFALVIAKSNPNSIQEGKAQGNSFE
jgi:hypothetical protein